MISVSQLTVQFGGKALFEDISFLVNQKDRIGLVGKNGAGKSTLLKILANTENARNPSISMQTDCTIGYLPQEMIYNHGKNVFDETATAFEEIKKLERKIEEYSHQISTREDYDTDEYMDIIQHLNDANERFSMIGGYNVQAQVEQILFGLGFTRNDLTRDTDEFSGGWRMRIELAKILLQKPSLILLDEPTNHLDIESIQWLEDFLKNYYGAVVLVSHDRDFLDNITNRTIEITTGKIYDFKCNYSKYVIMRKERIEQQISEQKNQEKYIEHTEELINKFRAKKNKAAFAQSLIKKLDKLEIVEVDETDNASIHFRFPPAPRSGKVVVLTENLSKSYGEKEVLKNIDINIEREETIAFVGQNGQGKTTLSKIIVGQLDYDGELKIGHNVSVGYYAQNQAEMLDGEKTIFQTIDDVATGEIRKNIRGLLGSFLFGGDDVDKKVKVLSGGEKSRLAMCKLLLQPYNLLVLDEPTNHLDMRSKDMLKMALQKYDGTLLIVSHDRNFLQGLTKKVYEFKDGKIKPYIGDIYDFLNERKVSNLNELTLKVKEKPVQITEEKKSTFAEQKEAGKEQRKLQNQVKKAEENISKFENELKVMDELLVNPETFKTHNNPEFFKKYDDIKKQLDDELENWEKLNEELEKI